MADQPFDMQSGDAGKEPQMPDPGIPGQEAVSTPGIPQQDWQSQGTKFDVTPSRPVQPQYYKPARFGPPVRNIAIIGVIVVVAVIGVLFASGVLTHRTVTTTIATTTAMPVGAISSCQAINASGSYYLSGDVSSHGSGACITIKASDVSLICNQNRITGSGPYGNSTPYTYGIAVNGSDDTISGCVVSAFSYGIYATYAPSLTLTRNNVSQNAMADVYLYNSPNSTLSMNYLSKAPSYQGALYMSGDTAGTSVYNNTITNNTQSGIYIDSSGNSFKDNYINGSQYSFTCVPVYGFPNSSTALSNTCYNNNGCDFATCMGTNMPLNFSAISLGSSIRTCGSINSPGLYSLENGLNASRSLSVQPCITVNASNVELSCNRMPITGAYIGISAASESGIQLSDCNISDSQIGIAFDNVVHSNVTNSTLATGSTGVLIQKSRDNTLLGLKATGYASGIYLSNSTLNTVQSFNASGNTYGIYLANSTGNVFTRGVAQNNSRMDVFATNSSAGQNYNLMQGTSCGLTDAAWATCAQHYSPLLKYYPVNGCMIVSRSGNYTLTSNVLTGSPECLGITANDVRFSCNGFSITQLKPSINSTAFQIANVNNVSLSNCTIVSFTRGITVRNATGVHVNSSRISSSPTGISLYRVSNSSVHGNRISSSSVAGISMLSVSNTSIYSNNVTQGSPGIGITMNASLNNDVYSNFMSGDSMGMYFGQGSLNNTVSNNMVQLSGTYDYACSPSASSLEAENGGVNYGTKKSGCSWLAAITQPVMSICTAFTSPTTYQFTSDMEYSTGTLCYGIYSNDTTINCMGHTVLAENGGTFALFKNVKSGTIENCNLKGFTKPIVAINSSVTVQNNTIFSNATGAPSQASISISNSQGADVLYNNITTESTGVALYNVSGNELRGNYVDSTYDAYDLSNATGINVQANTAHSLKGAGLVFSGSMGDTLENNFLYGFTYGLACIGSSSGSTSIVDNGQNTCSLQAGCSWLKASLSTC
ncbi:MAG: right-handed parallel beta-helix repeat-containing protein [Candidatus Marsarchaeota archaeon]|jgi:parallel beta-helix repeat protein|nr:right-handed parallel beta-helix repeat-containing protein [Candidatus Marsarchaeota archaeon]